MATFDDVSVPRATEMKVSDFPPQIRELVSRTFDRDGDGVVTADELQLAASMFEASNTTSDEITIAHLPLDAQEILKIFDADGNGVVRVGELAAAAKAHQESKQQNKRLTYFVGGLMFIIVMFLGVNAALMFAVIDGTKETRTSSDGVLRATTTTPGEEGEVVQVGSFATPISLTSDLPNEAFDELKFFRVENDNGAYISLSILGWYRHVHDSAAFGSYVKLITTPGVITIDADEFTFQTNMSHVFAQAGFNVTDAPNGRRLLGKRNGIGWFNKKRSWCSRKNCNVNSKTLYGYEKVYRTKNTKGTDCSKPCGGGEQRYRLNVKVEDRARCGGSCDHDEYIYRACNTQKCPPPPPPPYPLPPPPPSPPPLTSDVFASDLNKMIKALYEANEWGTPEKTVTSSCSA